MIYSRRNENELDTGLFKNPTSEYRGAPFWAWNCKLDKQTLIEQMDMLKMMGFGGFHIHVRTGMATSYLSEEYMDYVKLCIDKAKKDDMSVWLYDEDRWPSGSAGGIVTKNPKYRAKYLMFTPRPYGISGDTTGGYVRPAQGRGGNREENGTLLGTYDVCLNSDGTLHNYILYKEGNPIKGDLWYAYLETAVPNPWFNDQTYVNTLETEAIKEFTKVTHDCYYEAIGEEFGKSILTMFTDEPQYGFKGSLNYAHEKKDVFLPWTTSLQESYMKAYGQDIIDYVPELFWNLPKDMASIIRYRYHNHVTERFVGAFCDTVGDWCTNHNIMLTGHVMLEATLESQTMAVGEAMRCYRAFELPGIDILCDRHEYNTAKQTQSAVHQQGALGMLSELYGVTGWDYDFRGHKLQGDWQAALGVTARVHHLTWMSMKGEAKRDYPACIGYQSPWYDQYKLVEDHFSRVNTAMTRGIPQVRVAVIHPIESYWLNWGPQEQSAAIREQMEKNFSGLTEILIFGMIDFDFISESRFPELCEKGSNPMQVGKMSYDTVIVPACQTIRQTTLDRLIDFEKDGGKLIFLGDCPGYVDVVKGTEELCGLYNKSMQVKFEKSAIWNALEDRRFLDVRGESGAKTDYLIHQLRKDGENYWVFIANGKNPISPDVDKAEKVKFAFEGEYRVELYDTLEGNIIPIPAAYEGGKTIIIRNWFMHDSLLLCLKPGRNEGEPVLYKKKGTPRIILEKVPVILDEPNVLVLDLAEYALDDEAYQPLDEILRIDNYCRKIINIPLRSRDVTQPYLIEEETPSHKMRLRFTIPSEIEVEHPLLGLEEAKEAQIILNGQEVFHEIDGWYVDKAIETVKLPPIMRGINILEVILPIGKRTNTEWCYLLGDFGVRVDGIIKTVTSPVRELAFGNFTGQGLPFYTGNVTYQLRVQAAGSIKLRVPQYRGALLRVCVNGEDRGAIICSPYEIIIDGLEAGIHTIEIKLYGTRQNGFGQLHHTLSVDFYQSPDSWRTSDDLWCYEYQLKAVGILKSPEVYDINS